MDFYNKSTGTTSPIAPPIIQGPSSGGYASSPRPRPMPMPAPRYLTPQVPKPMPATPQDRSGTPQQMPLYHSPASPSPVAPRFGDDNRGALRPPIVPHLNSVKNTKGKP
ncbi:hypothetical protein UFOVP115_80 [uncultured Caudovirales phage]|uniref:Uncharacterized protein n=1 Tax=uncultured Caudovirales phage TaxID=2100421 RepID=A0A6J5L8U1_9CAUD|nr:hypothetical protein UFOVP115_80 [uncultured Caudovirales phage]